MPPDQRLAASYAVRSSNSMSTERESIGLVDDHGRQLRHRQVDARRAQIGQNLAAIMTPATPVGRCHRRHNEPVGPNPNTEIEQRSRADVIGNTTSIARDLDAR
ncbi:MAG: hypothetical protein ABWZ36_01470 [Jiangellaceae bacterium]